MIITKEYLEAHKTENGSYTRVQVEALGDKWGHMKKGWLKKLIGTELSPENAAKFESKKTAKDARRDKRIAKHRIDGELTGDEKTIITLKARIFELEEIIKVLGSK